METVLIPDDDRKGFTRGFIGQDVEFVDPVKYWADREITKHKVLIKDRLRAVDPVKTGMIGEEWFTEKAKEKWEQQNARIEATEIHPDFIELLTAKKKRQQIKLLRGKTLTPLQLAKLIFIASRDFGFTFSTYHAHQYHTGLDEDALPNFASVQEDGTVKTSGKTTLTDGQIRQVMSDRRIVISRFLDKGEVWHCFFITYRSLRSEESGNDPKPHFHYISDKWLYSREEAVKMFKGERYPTTKVHIPLLEYRKVARIFKTK